MTDKKTQTTKRKPYNQTMIFEVELNGVGMDFSMGSVIDMIREKLKGTECTATRGVSVSCKKIEVESFQ